MILGDVLGRNARCFTEHVAIVYENRSITYGMFAERVKRLANALIARGIKHQDRIAILAQNCPEYLEVHGVSELCGFVTVGLNYRLSAIEQIAILEDCQPLVFVFESEYLERAQSLRGALPSDALLLCIGALPDWAVGYEATLSTASDAAPVLRAREDDTAYLIYTSGTTGKAKGVMLSNRGQLEQARILSAVQTAQQDDRMLIVMPLYHIGGKIEQLAYLLVGATILLHRSFDPRGVLQNIQAHRATAGHFAPIMIQMMLEVLGRERFDFSSLRTICYASAPMSVALSRRAIAMFGPIFVQIYGMTEQGPGGALLKHQHRPEGSPQEAGRLASAGQPPLGVDVRVVRADGTDTAFGEVGEVWMRGPGLMQGYWNNPKATSEAIGTGWMRTGDMGYFDEEYFLFIVDRMKDMIISGGENVYSREVEEALELHPAVHESAVIGIPDEKWGESVKAFVSLHPGMSASEGELIEHCRSIVGSYKKPRSIEFLDALPRISSTNKVDKKALRMPFWANRDRQIS